MSKISIQGTKIYSSLIYSHYLMCHEKNAIGFFCILFLNPFCSNLLNTSTVITSFIFLQRGKTVVIVQTK